MNSLSNLCLNSRRHLGSAGIAAGAIAMSMAALAVAAPGHVDVETTRVAVSQPADRQNAAFATYCMVCHGVDGRGVAGLGVDLVSSPYVASASPGALVEFLKAGRLPNDPASVSGRPMPGFAYVDEAELAAIASYLKQRSEP